MRMNLRKMVRLVQQLKEEMHNGAHRAQAARLAKEYHELCEVNVLRLEQSASMAESDNIVGAVQLANQSPPLMEAMSVLVFDQVASWYDYCERNGLPQPPKFEEDSIKILTHALKNEDEIGPSHPLSREYARLMIDRNLTDAYGVLRTILQKDPENQAATQAKPGLERGILELKSRQLSEALNGSDNEQAIRIAEEVEELPFFAAEHMDNWGQAKGLQVENWLQQASSAISEDDWQNCASLLDNVSQGRSQVAGLNLSEVQERFIKQATDWVNAKEAEWLQEQEYREALKQLEIILTQRETDRVMNASLSLKMLREASNELSNRWQSVQDLEKPVPDEIIGRVDRERSALLWDIQQKEKGRMRVMVSVAAVFMVLCAFMVVCLVSYNSGKALQANLKVAMKERKVQVADDYMDEITLIGLKKVLVSGLGEAMKEANDFVRKEKESLKLADESVKNLISIKDKKFNSINLEQTSDVQGFVDNLSSATNKVEKLAPEYKSKLEDKLAIIQNAWGGHIEEKRVEIHGGYNDLLANMDKVRTDKLQPYQGPEPVRKGLDEMKPLLAKWNKDTKNWRFQAFEPTAAHESRFGAIQRAYKTFDDAMSDWDFTTRKIEVKAAGKNLTEYLAALSTLHNNLLLERKVESDLKAINNLGISLEIVQRTLLTPVQFRKDPNFLEKLKAPLDLRPRAPVIRAVQLLEDKIVDNAEVNAQLVYIFAAPFADIKKGIYLRTDWEKSGAFIYIEHTEPKFEFGKEMLMYPVRPGDQKVVFDKFTMLHIPKNSPRPVRRVVDIALTTYLSQDRLIRESGIRNLFDSRKKMWAYEALACLDSLNKIAADDVNNGVQIANLKTLPDGPPVPTVYKGQLNYWLVAYLKNILYELMNEQPGEWGLEWSPQAMADWLALTKMGADKITSDDWMLTARQKPDQKKEFISHFLKASKISYVTEARTYHALLRRAYANGRGISFVGYERNEPGKKAGETEEWLRTAGLGREIWGVNSKKQVGIMYLRDENGNYRWNIAGDKPMAFNPLFDIRVDCDKLLEEFKEKMGDREVYKLFLPLLFRDRN